MCRTHVLATSGLKDELAARLLPFIDVLTYFNEEDENVKIADTDWP